MQNMILQKCAWANIQTTVAYTKYTHTKIYIYIYIYIWAFSKGEEGQSGWWLLCVNKEKIKKSRKMIFQ